jgi:hypothetical protein
MSISNSTAAAGRRNAIRLRFLKVDTQMLG